MRRDDVNMRGVVPQAAWRQKAVRALVTHVRLGRLNVAIGRRLRSGSRDLSIAAERQLRMTLFKQLLDMILSLVVFSLPEVAITDATHCVDEIIRGPELIAERPPDYIIVVEQDGIGDVELLHRAPHIAGIFFEGELRSMNAKNNEAGVLISIRPCSHIRERSQTVNAGIGPKIDQNNVSLQCVSV